MRFSRLNGLSLATGALVLGLAAGGCVDTVGQARIDPVAVPQKIARRDGVSPRGATVALASLDGAPENVAAAFIADFNASASGYDMTIAEPKAAAYLVRGYLTAYPGDQNSTRFAYVFDVFDKRKVRVARLTDDAPVPAAAADPWALADVKIVRALAQRSAADLADALTNTPEAVAGTAVASAAGSTSVPQGTTTAPRALAGTAGADTRLGLAAAR
ncbi:MAG: hypothetical protein U1E28_09010 [Beijerinckiaceae bacterium]